MRSEDRGVRVVCGRSEGNVRERWEEWRCLQQTVTFLANRYAGDDTCWMTHVGHLM